ncbi:protein translocase subunit SecF [Thermomonospora cellulosilytica]|uniref:Protein-export membrane protein SecF n=1 Tax=Thermomonospora cellulosilytica TaxID=1411118 RepID=A0A7W3N055_9ACTN|nr:protein translocase subunit SecF [Thermomonospora cellulosilytica]MBA9005112.1 preprotein translocase subunit SecF [Thermomonospora cellulosilytica]
MVAIRAVLSRIYKGEVSADIVGRPRLWYSLSAILLAVSIAGLVVRGLSFGVEFTGGSVFTFKAPNASIEQVRSTVAEAGPHQVIVQSTSSGWRVTTESLPSAEVAEVQRAVGAEFGLPAEQVSAQIIGSTWGDEITEKAWLALAVFMLLIVGYLSVAFEWRMALAAMVALVHDLVITAGIYAWSGFEVTPATLLGFLTILGYSLYDAVVVFDMIKEVTRDLGTPGRLRTYSQAANEALNNTLVRSLNTSLVAILPVASILFVGTFLLGAGALKDLSLSLFVGILVGTYSSLCVATPLLVQLKEREPRYRELRERVRARQTSAKRQVRTAVPAGGAPAEETPGDGAAEAAEDEPRKVKVVQAGPRRQPRRGTRQQRRRTRR